MACGSVRRMTKEFRKAVFSNSAVINCTYCDQPLTYDESTADHIMPHSKGGSSRPHNLTICCRPCNTQKGCLDKFPDIILGEDYVRSLMENNVPVRLIPSDTSIRKKETQYFKAIYVIC